MTFSRTEKWCAGLKSVGLRDLTGNERQEATQCARRDFIYGASGILGLPLLTALMIVAAPIVIGEHGDNDIGVAVYSILILLIIFLGVPVTLLFCRDRWRRSRCFSQLARNGAVIRFEGILVHRLKSDIHQATMLKKGVLQIDHEHPQSLELFPNTNIVYKVNDTIPSIFFRADIAEVSSDGAARATAVVPSGWLAEEAPPEIAASRRPITDQERIELRRHICRLSFKWWGLVLVVLFIYACAHLASQYFERRTINLVEAFRLLLPGIFTFVWIARLRFAWKLWGDYRLGIVLRFEKTAAPDETPPNSTSVFETLARSGTLWSVNAEPVEWRITR